MDRRNLKRDVQRMKAYLAGKGIPRQMIEEIRLTFVNDALLEANDMKYDRIYSGIGLMLRREFNFGVDRIMRGLRMFDQLCGSVCEEGYSWEQLMADLDKEVGIVIKTNEDDRLICEYKGYSKEREKEIEEEKKNAGESL